MQFPRISKSTKAVRFDPPLALLKCWLQFKYGPIPKTQRTFGNPSVSGDQIQTE